MTELGMALTELLRKYKTAKDEDVLREGGRLLAHEGLKQAIAEVLAGASR